MPSAATTGPPPSRALEARLAGGVATSDLWLQLARAQLRRTPPDPARAAQAAWQAFTAADAGAPEIPSLLAMADAFRAMDRPECGDPGARGGARARPERCRLQAGLADARRAAGMLVRRVRTETGGRPAARLRRVHLAPVPPGRFRPG